VRTAFTQPALFSNREYELVDAVLLGADPPRHAAAHAIVAQLFSREVLANLAALAQEKAEDLVRPEMDIVADYGVRLARYVTAQLIGFSDETVAQIVSAEETTRADGSGLPALTRSLDALADGATLYTHLARAGDGVLDDAAVRSLIRLLWLAGTTTTERVIARAVLTLLQHPALHDQIRADPDLLGPFIEEVLRLHPPEHMVPRIATAAVELRGVTIPAGARVQLCVSAANRDPAQFTEPAEIRLQRTHHRHFAFGNGIHHCIGSRLAREVITIAVRTLVCAPSRIHARQALDTIAYFQTPTALTPLRLQVGLDP
jgi:cytochrome P450